jgi:hypothetical protein
MGEIHQTEITEGVIQILEENPLKEKEILQLEEYTLHDQEMCHLKGNIPLSKERETFQGPGWILKKEEIHPRTDKNIPPDQDMNRQRGDKVLSLERNSLAGT